MDGRCECCESVTGWNGIGVAGRDCVCTGALNAGGDVGREPDA